MPDVPAPNPSRIPGLRSAGFALGAAAVLSIAVVALDQPATGKTPAEVLQSVDQLRRVHQSVHFGAMACTAVLAFGFTRFAQVLDLRRGPVLAGLLACLAGCVAMFGATLLDGFVTPDLAAAYGKLAPERVQAGYELLKFTGVALTDLARLAWALQAAGALAWSPALLRGRSGRVTGILGLASGSLVAWAALSSGPRMSLASILQILAAQLVWNLAAAAFLVRRSRREDPARVAPTLCGLETA